MKTVLALLAATAVLGFAAPTSAMADHYNNGSRRIVSYMRCGTPVYAVYQVVGYDRCGNPVGQWVTQNQQCGCQVCNPRPVYAQPGCNNPYGHQHGYGGYNPGYSRSRSGLSFSFGFGR